MNSFMLLAVAAFSQATYMLQLNPYNAHDSIYQNNPLVLIDSDKHHDTAINLDFNYKKYLHGLSKNALNSKGILRVKPLKQNIIKTA